LGLETANGYRYTQLSRYLATCGVLAPLLVITFVLIGASVTPGYNHISDTISKLASPGTPHPEWMNAGFISYGILIIGLSFAVRQCLAPRSGSITVWLLIVIHGVGIILAAVFPYDLSVIEGIHSLEGILHHLVTITGCVAFIIGILIMDRIVSGEHAWRTTIILSFFAVSVVSVLFVFSLFPIARGFEGASQRASAFAMIIYIEALSIRCLTLPPVLMSSNDIRKAKTC
jgi:hypothetical membrane protein